ncbi:MFS transporter [Paenibacillus swuensis]|uniref:Bcr/CflA family efflux transporter n=1 Tax=Paenibacillus swuensis TaxID=1178515 RepID=A0A172TEN2_9BACL|nr:multidrug effflux MFS transporter [Paenibacillus swuensis]ANE45509.1 MFS transporter [Paenibacillus swuensis]
MKLTNNSADGALSKNSSKTGGALIGLILLLGSLSAFGPLSLDMYLPALPALAQDLHTNAYYAQLSLTACLMGLAAGQLFAGPLSDVRGRKGPLIAGLVLYALISILCSWAPTIQLFLMLRFIQGMAGSAGIVISRAIARDLYAGKELTKFYAMLMLVNGAAPILAPIIGGQLLKVMEWRGIFMVLSGIGGLLLLGSLFGLKETLPQARRSAGGFRNMLSTFGLLLKDRSFMGYALTQGFVIAGMFAYIAGSPFVVQEVFGKSPQFFSVIFAVNGAGIILASQLTGRLSGKLKDSTLFAMGLATAATGGASLLLVNLAGGGLYAMLPPLFLIVAAVGIVGTSGFPLAMQNYGHHAGTASALLGLLSYILGSLLAPFVGMIGGTDAAAWPMAAVIAAAEAMAVLCYLTLVRVRK